MAGPNWLSGTVPSQVSTWLHPIGCRRQRPGRVSTWLNPIGCQHKVFPGVSAEQGCRVVCQGEPEVLRVHVQVHRTYPACMSRCAAPCPVCMSQVRRAVPRLHLQVRRTVPRLRHCPFLGEGGAEERRRSRWRGPWGRHPQGSAPPSLRACDPRAAADVMPYPKGSGCGFARTRPGHLQLKTGAG